MFINIGKSEEENNGHKVKHGITCIDKPKTKSKFYFSKKDAYQILCQFRIEFLLATLIYDSYNTF